MDVADIIRAHAQRVGELESDLICARVQIGELQQLLAAADTRNDSDEEDSSDG